jgi:hypothetical protein
MRTRRALDWKTNQGNSGSLANRRPSYQPANVCSEHVCAEHNSAVIGTVGSAAEAGSLGIVPQPAPTSRLDRRAHIRTRL